MKISADASAEVKRRRSASRAGVATFTPLRFQATESDCYPTCVLNALTWLFRRHELPGAIVQHVYAASLDGIERGVTGAYTTEYANLALMDWLASFRTPAFAVATEVLHGSAVRVIPRGRLVRWLKRGGVAIIDVVESARTTHSLLVLGAARGQIDCWDPYLRDPQYDYGPNASRLPSSGYSPNLRLAMAWLDAVQTRPYSCGPLANRSCVLIQRVRRGGRRTPGS